MVRSQWAGVKVLQQQSLAEHGSISCCYKRKTWCVIVCNCNGVLFCSLRTDFSCLCWGCVAARMATWVVKNDGIWQEGSPSGTNRHHQKNGLGGATQEWSAHSLCWYLSGFSRHTTFLEHLELNIPESYRKPTADSEKSRPFDIKIYPWQVYCLQVSWRKIFYIACIASVMLDAVPKLKRIGTAFMSPSCRCVAKSPSMRFQHTWRFSTSSAINTSSLGKKSYHQCPWLLSSSSLVYWWLRWRNLVQKANAGQETPETQFPLWKTWQD